MDIKVCSLCNSPVPQHKSAWIKPCLCPDSEVEVHYRCLLFWLQWQEETFARYGQDIYCRVCSVRFKILPERGPLVRVLVAIDQMWFQDFCELAMKLLTVVFVDMVSTTAGLAVLYDVYGRTGARDMILAMDPFHAVSICQAIPLTCVFLNSLQWEEFILNLLRRWSKTPIVGRILPLEDNNVIVPENKQTIVDYITGGLLLPTFAGVTGNLVFFNEPSNVKRLILGGAVFILLKGFLKAYCKQKNYVRESCLTITNSTEHT